MLIRISDVVLNTDFIAGAVIDDEVVRIVFSCPVPVAPNQMGTAMDFTGEAAVRLRSWLSNRRNVQTLGPNAARPLCGELTSDQPTPNRGRVARKGACTPKTPA